jgi:hypothetical protein
MTAADLQHILAGVERSNRDARNKRRAEVAIKTVVVVALMVLLVDVFIWRAA